MKAWNFKLKSSPKEISEKLESELQSIGGFAFSKTQSKPNSITFELRKRITYAWYLAYQNWTTVHGEILKQSTDSNSKVVISFNQHFLIKLIIWSHVIFGLVFLIAFFSEMELGAAVYILSGSILAAGILLWVLIQRKFERDIQKYKSLIIRIFEIQ